MIDGSQRKYGWVHEQRSPRVVLPRRTLHELERIDHQLAKAGCAHSSRRAVDEFCLWPDGVVRSNPEELRGGEFDDCALLTPDGLPTAIVEAKKSARDALAGERQASVRSTLETSSRRNLRPDMFHLCHTISREIGLPIIPEERRRYSITQLLADIVRRRGFDRIRFPSSVARGSNYSIFKPALFKAQDPSAKVVHIKGLQYE